MGAHQSVFEKSIKLALNNDRELYALPSKPFYAIRDVKLYNHTYPVKPAAVTYPRTAEEVAAVIKCAADAGLKVQARSGGHSYANYCMFPQSLFEPLLMGNRPRRSRWSGSN